MRQPKRHVKKLRRPHTSPNERRNVIAVTVTAAVAGLCAYLLPSSSAPSLYASSGAESGAFKALATGNTCAHSTIIPMDPNNAQSGVTKGKYYVTNDTWNADRYMGLLQALYVCNYNSWYAIANMNDDTGDGAVKTSPNVQETWYPVPAKLSSWKSITSQFSDIPPGAGANYGIWEFEYDVWLNGLADTSSTEVMIWTYNNGQTPSGSLSGVFSDAGHTYNVYRRSAPRQYVAFVDRSNNLSGNVDLLDFFNYVISRGWIPKSSTLFQICDGVELVSTNSKPEKFAINNFSINMKAYLHGSAESGMGAGGYPVPASVAYESLWPDRRQHGSRQAQHLQQQLLQHRLAPGRRPVCVPAERVVTPDLTETVPQDQLHVSNRALRGS